VPYPTLHELTSHLNQLLSIKQYAAALDLLRNELPNFPDHTHLIHNYQLRVLAQMGDVEGAFATFEQSLAHGYWFPIHWLADNDSDFANIAHRPKFKDLQFQSLALQKAAAQQSKPELHLYPPADTNRKLPLLYILHGNNGTAQESFDHWQSLVEYGWLLATPQSSQLMSPHAYMWNDQAIADLETGQHLESIHQQYAIDPTRIVVGGFSRGAGYGLVAAFSGIIPATAFLTVTPVFPDIEDALEPHLDSAQTRDMRGYIIAGAKDYHYLQRVEFLSKWLSARHIAHQYNERPDLDHDYPADFSDVLVAALDYLFPE
jgi:hypothetical protein